MPTGIPFCAENAGAAFADSHFLMDWAGSALGIERIEVATVHRAGRPAGSEIVGLHVRLGRDDLDGQPAPPSAVVAAIRLTIGQPVTDGFEETFQARRKDAGRIT
jgi:hypothetical protein